MGTQQGSGKQELALHSRLASAAPPPLAKKLRAAEVSGERKPVTALFTDVVGSTALAESMDPEEWVAVLNRVFEAISAEIYRYEGTIAQLVGDAVVAFFGAPVAHEDDPERAVRAALDIAATVRHLAEELRATLGIELQVRMGINTGVVVVGTVGSDLRYEYTALGDAVNVAARMQTAAAPGSILITEATYRLVAAQTDVIDLGFVTLKGKTDPVRAYELVGVRAGREGRALSRSASLSSPMVGRDQHLAELRGLLGALETGRGGLAFVVGDPGIGKSRLLAEFRVGALEREPNLVWLEGRCLSYGRNLPHHLLLDVLRSLAGIPASADDDTLGLVLKDRVRKLLREDWEETFSYLAHLIGVPIDDPWSSRLADFDPMALKPRYAQALIRVVEALAAKGGVVLVCEDIHWSDTSSVELVKDLMPLVPEAPALLLFTSRPDHDAAGWQLVAEARGRPNAFLREIRLEPLGEGDSRALVENLLEIESLPQITRRLILDRTEGNPFFLEELIRMLIDRGVIVRSGDRWVGSRGLADVSIPETLHGLLLARIDRLPPSAKEILRMAAVVGRRFPLALLKAVATSKGWSNVEDDLATLGRYGLVYLAATEPDPEYLFRHALLQEAAYESVLKHQRRALHRIVGETLEAQYEKHRGEGAAVVAHHFERAGEPQRAVEYLLEAGRRALERFAVHEAREFYRRAGSYLGEADESKQDRRGRVEAILGQVEAGFTFVPTEEQLAIIEPAIPDAEALGDPALITRVHAAVAVLRHWRGEWYATSPKLRRSLDRAREVAEISGEERLLGAPLALLGRARVEGGEYHEAIALLHHAMRILGRQENFAEGTMAAQMLALAHARLGNLGAAQTWAERGAELAQRSGDPNAILDADLVRGSVEAERGNLEEALRFTERAVQLADDAGNIACALVGNFMIGDQHLRRGDPTAAIAPLERSGNLAAFCDAWSFAALSNAWLAAARARLGEGEHLAELDASIEQARTMGDPLGEGQIVHHRATVLAAQADPDWTQSFSEFEEAERIFERLGAKPYLARALRDHAAALQVAGREAEAQEHLKQAHSLFNEMGLVSEVV